MQRSGHEVDGGRKRASRERAGGSSTASTPRCGCGNRSPRTEEVYLHWMRRFFTFHGGRHPAELGAEHVTAFLSDLATRRHVAASHAEPGPRRAALLYRDVLRQDLPWLNDIVRAQRPVRLPVVMSRDEVRVVLATMDGPPRLMATLLYGSGPAPPSSAAACASRTPRLRAPPDHHPAGQGRQGTASPCSRPRSTIPCARTCIASASSTPATSAPAPAGSNSPAPSPSNFPPPPATGPGKWLFPATRLYLHPQTAQRRRHHLHETVVQQAVRRAALAAGLTKRVTTTPSATPSQRTCSKTATTSAPSSNSSVTATSRPP